MRKVWIENDDGTLTFSTSDAMIYEVDASSVVEFAALTRRGASGTRHLIRLLLSSGGNVYLKFGLDAELAVSVANYIRENSEAKEVGFG